MDRRRRTPFGLRVGVLSVLLLSGCSPLNQGAVTLDEATQLPMLVLTFCSGEGVEAVRLTEVQVDDGTYEEGRTLWRIEAEEPQPVETVIAGQVPDGFHEVVAMPTDLPDDLVMMAENGGEGGIAAEQGGGAFSLSELEAGVLLQDGDETSAAKLRDDARTNCSSSLFGSLGLPTWLDAVAAVLVGVLIVAGLVLAVRRCLRRQRLLRLPKPAPGPSGS